MDRLEDIRKRINEIDAQIAALFEQRMLESRNVVGYKMEKGLSITDPVREKEVISRNSALVRDDTIREYYMNFAQELMSLSRAYQERMMNGMKVAYCGVPGAFACIASSKMYPDSRLVPFRDFEQAYRACETGECDVAVLPFENSSSGEVAAVTDLMFSGNLYINQVIEIEAVQNLLGCEGATPDTVKEVFSHPQALFQCSKYIREHDYCEHDYPNTAVAAKLVAEKQDPSIAAIASAECAELYGLKVLERHINASSNNTTRFAAFSKVLNTPAPNRKMGHHFILMFTAKNEAGSLAQTLNIIGAHGFNMCCLRSRPMKDLLWNYYFFIELDGDINTEEGRSMMIELSTLCDRLKLVGTF